MTIPKTAKGISDRITKIRSQLSAFKREYGGHDDSGGSRYYLFYLYFLLDDSRRSSEYIRWYQKEFPDDGGEPFALLCWALILHRMGKDGEPILAQAMLSNVYLLPHLLGNELDRVDMWHFSNQAEPDALEYFPERVRQAITAEDISWIRQCYESDRFQRVLKRHIEINRELPNTPPGVKRSALVNELFGLLDDRRC